MKNKVIKRAFLIIFAIVTIFILIFFFLFYQDKYKNLIEHHKELIRKEGKIVHDKIENNFEVYYAVSQTYNNYFKKLEDIEPIVRREHFRNITIKMLLFNKFVKAFWCDFDSNAFDSLDNYYAKQPEYDQSGRFNISYFRENENIRSENIFGFIDDPEADYYTQSRIKNKTIIFEPYWYSYKESKITTSNDTNATLMITITSPVHYKQNIIGVTGVDIPINELIHIADSLTFFNHNFVRLLSQKGYYLHSDNKELIGQTIFNNQLYSYSTLEALSKKFQKNKEFEIDLKSNLNEKFFVFCLPIAMSNSNEYMYFLVNVPYKLMVKEATDLLPKFLICFTLYFILSITFIQFFFSKYFHTEKN